MLEHGADLGIAHDGDADRCLAVAADGSDVDGDVDPRDPGRSRCSDRGRLAGDTVVGTVMANIGFHQAMAAAGHHGARPPRSATGTCWRTCAPAATRLGGEQSGHVVLADHATTGDGLLTALHLMARWPRPAGRWPSWRRWSSGSRRC